METSKRHSQVANPLPLGSLACLLGGSYLSVLRRQTPFLVDSGLHVIPSALFALVHASILYRIKGILIFTAFCLGVAGFCESLSLRTGVPYGHYYFTGVMGPKAFQLPILLVFAYLEVGYLSWGQLYT